MSISKYLQKNSLTVRKIPTTLKATIDDFKIGETGKLIARLTPEHARLHGIILIDGEQKAMLYTYMVIKTLKYQLKIWHWEHITLR